MTRLPVDLALQTVTVKVSKDAWERAQKLKSKFGVRLSDVVSVALLYIPETDMERVLNEQKTLVDNLPKSVRGMLRDVDKLSPAERKAIRDILE